MRYLVICCVIFLTSCSGKRQFTDQSNQLFHFDENMTTRWSSPENLNGAKGAGGQENNGAKGHAFDSLPAGKSISLLDIKDMGIIRRIWITIDDRSSEMLRSLRIDMYWDNASKPAVSVPFGDFFGVGLGRTTTFENALFANAEGRSFNCFIPMPFMKGAKIMVTNESAKTLRLFFFDVDYTLVKGFDETPLYFHSSWRRDTSTQLARDYEILPAIQGKGRFLGANIGVNASPAYGKSWFGEGEVKIYLDGDQSFPTLNGTGTEDYIGTAWGQGMFINRYTGCPISNDSLMQWSFYRYHIPDPIYFRSDCRVTIQAIGGDIKKNVINYLKQGAKLLPVSIAGEHGFTAFFKKDSLINLEAPGVPDGWTNFYRSDDYSSTAYFYLDRPENNLPGLAPVSERLFNLK
jgi:hypothetical protein